MLKFIVKLFYVVSLIFSFSCFANPADFRDNTALVIIDMQPYFVTRGGNDKDEKNQKKVKEIIKNQIEAIKVAKASQIPIIFIEYEGMGDTNEELKKATEGYTDVKHILKDSDGMLSYDNKYTPELEKYLESKKIGNLIITGANGGACVQESVLSSVQHNYNVISFSKGIADFNYKEFIYPYVHEYKIKTRDLCENCKFKAVADLETIALDLATKKANKDYINLIINNSGRSSEKPKSEVIKLDDQQQNSGVSK